MKAVRISVAGCYAAAAVGCAFYGLILISLGCVAGCGASLLLLKEKR